MTDYLDENRAIPAFRRAVPQHLQPYILTKTGKPRTEWRFSLKTSDKALARERCRIEGVKTDALIREAEERRRSDLVERAKPSAQRELERDIWEAQLENDERNYRDMFEREMEFEEREPIRQRLIAVLSRPLGELTSAEAAMRDLIPDEEFDPPEVKAARQAKIDADWAEGAREAARAFAARKAGSEQLARSISAMFEAYADEAGLEPATRKRWKPVIQHFVDYTGHDDPQKITRDNVLAWKQVLQAQKDGAGSKVRGPRTIREVYLAALKATLNWGVENLWLGENPADKITVRVKKKARLREPDFTREEALLILRKSLESHSGKLPPEHALARRWVPWLCAYTGARVNEITQLRREDVAKIGETWTIRITPEAGSQKKGEARTVPLHSHLVEQGFQDVALARPDGPLFYDPSRGRGGNVANPQYKKVGERIAAWVRQIGVDDPDVQPNHAWRHLFKTRARNAKMDVDAREAIPGHDPGTEGRRYGTNDVPFLAAEIEKLPRFSFE
ncbi:DUF6538 domain-containing protein [Caulobacter sp. NIBR2454]|uniref:DUF6538 domain-containing protein n=1 Tax=Caulobacter sp. NIBR2454 TaxID=3015996 RepID=UPI0022B5FA6F|nr:DUF6538 domain-containing protein [Caulobacter sp. NIBR2454]